MSTIRPTIVAIPACNEEDRIGKCLAALLSQKWDGLPLPRDALHIVVLANNCVDATALVADSFNRTGQITVLEKTFVGDRANAGVARRTAMQVAAERLGPEPRGVICSTDADSRPRPDWISNLWRAFDDGAEAIAGAVDFDPEDQDPIPHFSDGRANEAVYSGLQAELIARVDPELCDPWPRHLWEWGANMAVTAQAYARVGGLPAAPLAEDRAFFDRLRRHDVPIRHCLEARVWTSPRAQGRAPGGLADLLKDHMGTDREPCDAMLEPALTAFRRAAWRARLRGVHGVGDWPLRWAARLRISSAALDAAMRAATFGSAWADIAMASPVLKSSRLMVDQLPREIAQAERLLIALRRRASTGRRDTALVANAGLWSNPAPRPL